MKTKSIISKIMVVAASVLMLAAITGGNAYAGLIIPGPGGLGVQVNFNGLPGIVPASFPNFENSVKVRVLKNGNKGFKLKIRKKGKGSFFNTLTESLQIKGAKYKLNAFFDNDGNFLSGDLKIKGKVDTSAGKAKGTLMTATLDNFAYTSILLGFNTSNIVCNSVINAFLGSGGCTTDESVIISLADGGFDPTLKGYKSNGLSVASVPVPAAVWLFGSGLLGLVGMTRGRKH